MDAVKEDGVQEIVVMSSAQIGKTEVINNTVGYYISHEPSPILLVMPTLEMCSAWSKDRFAPMLRDSPILHGLVKDPRARDSGNTILHKTFPGGHITLSGANSPASLASRPIRVVLCDEVDRYDVSAGTEGDPVNLAKKRAQTFWNRKIILTSTPTIKGASRIEYAYEQSDKRRYFVPCPHCDNYQVLKWENIKWDSDKGKKTHSPETAAYYCEECGTAIQEQDKGRMILRGRWQATAPFNGIAGFHINELYSPWVKWSEMVASFISAKKLPETLKTWINTSLGQTWEEKGEEASDTDLISRKEAYGPKLPGKVLVLTAGVDVQDDRLEAEIIGWGLDEESWSIDYAIFHGQPDTARPWKMLADFLGQTFETVDGTRINVVSAFVDSGGHYTIPVYRWCKKHQVRGWYASRGGNTPGSPIVGKFSKRNSEGCKLFTLGVDSAKAIILGRLQVQVQGPGFCHFPDREYYGDEYFKQLTAEKAVTRYKNGHSTTVWIKTRSRNEAFDCRVYGYAAFVLLKPNLPVMAANREGNKKQNQAQQPPRRTNSFVNSWRKY